MDDFTEIILIIAVTTSTITASLIILISKKNLLQVTIWNLTHSSNISRNINKTNGSTFV